MKINFSFSCEHAYLEINPIEFEGDFIKIGAFGKGCTIRDLGKLYLPLPQYMAVF